MKGVDFYSYKINKPVDQSSIDQLVTSLPRYLVKASSRKKILTSKFLSLKGWELLAQALEKHQLGDEINNIDFSIKGKPFIKNKSIYFNFSNVKDAIVLILSDREIGVDFEYIRKVRQKIFERVFSQNEISSILNSDSSSLKFTELWTRKEAVVKLFGGGLSMGLSTFEVLDDEITAFDKKVVISRLEVEEGICHMAQFK